MRKTLQVLIGVCVMTLCHGAHHSSFAQSPKEKGEKPVFIQAGSMTYDQKTQNIIAEGDIHVEYAQWQLTAHRLVYNKETGIMTAQGNTILYDSVSHNTLYADEIILNKELTNATADHISARLEGNRAALKARNATRFEGKNGALITRFSDVVYSPCHVCDQEENPLWQIRAAKLTDNRDTKMIQYQDADFQVYGQTLASVPFFEHPSFDVKRKTGFLLPKINGQSQNGLGVSVPWFWAITQDKDLTITPTLYLEQIPLLKTDYRQRFNHGFLSLNLAGTYSDRMNEGAIDNRQRGRGSVMARGRFEETPQKAWGFDIQRASDDTFTRRYEILEQDRLQTRGFWEYNGLSDKIEINSFWFQGLRPTDRDGYLPLILPYITWEHTLGTPIAGGETTIDTNIIALTRQHGMDTYRLSSTLAWNKNIPTSVGVMLDLYSDVRTDIYYLNKANQASQIGMSSVLQDGSRGRIIPTQAVTARLPLSRNNFGFDETLEPIAQLIWSPYQGDQNLFPNEDSGAFEFDEFSLFSIHKFPGNDRMDTGPRANIGTRYNAFFGNGSSLYSLIGQTYRLRENNNFSPESGLWDQESDYITSVTYVHNDTLSLTHRTRIDKEQFEINRMEYEGEINLESIRLLANYTTAQKDMLTNIYGKREELTLATAFPIYKEWHFYGAGQRDLENNRMSSLRGGVFFKNECIIVDLGINRRYTRDRDLEPGTGFGLKLHLLPFGD